MLHAPGPAGTSGAELEDSPRGRSVTRGLGGCPGVPVENVAITRLLPAGRATQRPQRSPGPVRPPRTTPRTGPVGPCTDTISPGVILPRPNRGERGKKPRIAVVEAAAFPPP